MQFYWRTTDIPLSLIVTAITSNLARKRYARRGRRRRAVSDHEMAESVKIQKTEETKEEAEKPPAEDTQKRKSKLTAYEEKTPNER